MRVPSRPSTRLELEAIRLPLIALIDVVLFLLFYFIVAGTIAAPEAELGATLGVAGGEAAQDAQPQILLIEMGGDGPEFRVGERMARGRDELAAMLSGLPVGAGLILRPAPEVPVEATATAMQVGEDVGFEQISYMIAR